MADRPRAGLPQRPADVAALSAGVAVATCGVLFLLDATGVLGVSALTAALVLGVGALLELALSAHRETPEPPPDTPMRPRDAAASPAPAVRSSPHAAEPHAAEPHAAGPHAAAAPGSAAPAARPTPAPVQHAAAATPPPAAHPREAAPVLLGVCAALARRTGLPPWMLRGAAVVIGLTGTGILVYLIAALALDDGRGRRASSELAALTILLVALAFAGGTGLPYAPGVVWPIALALSGVLVSRSARRRPDAPRAQELVAVGLVVAAALVVLASSGALHAARDVGLAVLVVLAAVGAVLGPWLLDVARRSAAERAARARADERAELAGLLELVGEAGTAAEAVEVVLAAAPDVVLLDVHLPDGDGAGVITAVRAAGGDVQFLALSVSDAADDVIAVVRAGARGYVTKAIAGPELAAAVERVKDGDAVFSPRLAGYVLDAFAGPPDPAADDPELDQLTPRERDVLRDIARGYLYKEVAHHLGISVKTVEAHMGSVLRKLQLSSRHELARWASARGMD